LEFHVLQRVHMHTFPISFYPDRLLIWGNALSKIGQHLRWVIFNVYVSLPWSYFVTLHSSLVEILEEIFLLFSCHEQYRKCSQCVLDTILYTEKIKTIYLFITVLVLTENS
jgi:hypothetical protein